MSENGKPPTENLVRAFRSGVALRAAADGGMPTLHGHFAVFNRWAEIDSWFEGHFFERVAPGAFKKTFRETKPKVLFQHGQDPQIGDKPLGPIESLSEDAVGAAYEVPLLDTSYNRDLIPGLEAGLYGASFRFKVLREEIVDDPQASDYNPHGLQERTIKEAKVMEFGPVTFPAYADATAGVRSLTDRFLFDALERDPTRARDLLQHPERLREVTEALRFDNEDVSPLAQMIALGTEFIDDQDEPDEQARMQTVLTTLSGLLNEEAETEPGEEQEGRPAPSTDAAHSGTSGTERRESPKTWPHVSQDEWESLQWNRRT